MTEEKNREEIIDRDFPRLVGEDGPFEIQLYDEFGKPVERYLRVLDEKNKVLEFSLGDRKEIKVNARRLYINAPRFSNGQFVWNQNKGLCLIAYASGQYNGEWQYKTIYSSNQGQSVTTSGESYFSLPRDPNHTAVDVLKVLGVAGLTLVIKDFADFMEIHKDLERIPIEDFRVDEKLLEKIV